MNSYSTNPNHLNLDFESLPIESISLPPEAIVQAVKLSNDIFNQERQWQTYLDALALFAFESWVQLRIPEISINSAQCSLQQPKYSNVIEGVFNLQVGEFKLCLIATGSMDDQVITIPRALIDLPEYTAHFYVVINVQEEQEEANVEAFISYDQLREYLQSVNLQAQPDWTYELSWDCLNPEPNNLLLYLRCLEPTAIALPRLSTNRVINRSNIQAQLQSLIPQLKSGEIALWQLLDWETAIPLLTDDELLDWLYQVQTGRISISQQLTETGRKLTQQVINVGSWLQNEIDQLAQNLAWNLLPAPVFATSSLRFLPATNSESPQVEMEMIIAQLRDSGMDIPVEARGAYQDFNLGTHPLRLYAVTWAIAEPENLPEWTLLVVLGTQADHQLPINLCLQLQENNTLLDEQIVQNSPATYLYSRVIGTYDEQFTVTITLENGASSIFPTFTFIPE